MPIFEDLEFGKYVENLPAATEDDMVSGNNMPLIGKDNKKFTPSLVSGKTEVTTGVRRFKSSDLISYRGIPGAVRATWYSSGRHVAIPVNAGDTFIIEPSLFDSNYAMFGDEYVPGDQASDSAVPFSSKYNFRHAAAGPVTITASLDDSYLILVVVDGGGSPVEWDVRQLVSNQVRQEIDGLLPVIFSGRKKQTDKDYFHYFGAIGGSGSWYDSNRKTSHVEIPLKQGVSVIVTPSKSARIMIFGSSYSPGDKSNGVPLDGEGRNPFVIAGSYIVTPGKDDVWLVLTTVDGSFSSVSWSIELLDSSSVAETEQILNVDTFSKYHGIPNDSNEWYVDGRAKHIAIPLTADDCFKFKTVGNPANYVVVNSEYVPGLQSSKTAVPLSSRNFKRGYIPADGEMEITAHSDDAYLILTCVDGAGVTLNWEIKKILAAKSQVVRKLRYAHWNIGGFSNGTSTGTTITPEQKTEKQAQYRALFNSLSTDFLCVAEDTREFCLDGTSAIEAVYSCFLNKSYGTKQAYNSNSIYNNMEIAKDDHYVVFENKRQYRYIHEQEYIWNGKSVIVAETHLDFTDWTDEQIAVIIERYKDKPYVIISGDWNTNFDSQYEPFKTAGYSMAFLDYMPHVSTYCGNDVTPASDLCIDNVMVKGFVISNAHLVEDSSALSDHKMVVCDLTMR